MVSGAFDLVVVYTTSLDVLFLRSYARRAEESLREFNKLFNWMCQVRKLNGVKERKIKFVIRFRPFFLSFLLVLNGS